MVFDTVEKADVRHLKIEKAVKGFALTTYVFKEDCQVTSMNADSVRWFQETAADLTATAPSAVANISPLSNFPTLEASWQRNVSYYKKYGSEGFISMEDQKASSIDVVARTLLRLTRAVAKQVDNDIWNVITEDQSAVNINSVSSTASWNAGSGQDPIEDIMDMKLQLWTNNYNPEGATLFLSPTDHKNLLTWLITTKGSSVPTFASERTKDGKVMSILGVNIKVSNQVTADYAALVIPKVACTWYQFSPITSVAIEDKGIGTKYRVWEAGVAVLTDPKAVCLLTNTQA